MSLKEKLDTRSGGICELCSSTEILVPYEVSPSDGSIDQTILICSKCKDEASNDNSVKIDTNKNFINLNILFKTVP